MCNIKPALKGFLATNGQQKRALAAHGYLCGYMAITLTSRHDEHLLFKLPLICSCSTDEFNIFSSPPEENIWLFSGYTSLWSPLCLSISTGQTRYSLFFQGFSVENATNESSETETGSLKLEAEKPKP